MNQIKFSVDNIELLDQVNDSLFAKARISAFASGDNFHHIIASDDTLKKCASSIYLKPLVWKYDWISDDATTHSKLEVPCGVIYQEDNPISFERLDDGRLMLTVNALIWKKYSGKIMDIFKRDGGIKPVSAELFAISNEENPDGSEEMGDFCFTAITILGTNVTPAVEDAKIQIIQYSTDLSEYEKKHNKYSSIDFSIPENVIDEIHRNKNITSICRNNFDYLISNKFISPKKVQSMQKYFSKYSKKIDFEEGVNWLNNISSQMEGVNMSVKDKLGKSPSINIDNSKDSAIMSGTWNGQDAGFLNKLLEASNHSSLVKEAYLIVDGDGGGDLSVNAVKYPHHEIKGDKLVVSTPGIQAAFARARQQGVATGAVMAHIKKHYNELGLSKENFATFGLSEDDFSFMFASDTNNGGEKMTKEEKKGKFSAFCDGVKFTKDEKEMTKYCYIDSDDDFCYCYDNESGKFSAIPYSVDGDEIKCASDGAKMAKMGFTASDADEDDDVYMATKAMFTSDANTEAVAAAKFNDMKADYDKQLATMSAELETTKTEMAATKEENGKLKQEKDNKEKIEMAAKVDFALTSMFETVPKDKEDEYNAIKEDAKNYNLETFSAWENKLKAFAFDCGVISNKEKKEFRMGLSWDIHIPNEDKNSWNWK